MKHRTVTSIILIGLFSTAASAADQYNDIEENCRRSFGDKLNNSIVMGCADQASNAVKKDMNKVYQKIYKELESRGPDATTALETAQKSWLVYRDNFCDLQGLTVGTPMYSTCRYDLNLHRLSELNTYFEEIK